MFQRFFSIPPLLRVLVLATFFALGLSFCVGAHAGGNHNNHNANVNYNIQETNATQSATVSAQQDNTVTLAAPGAPGLSGSGVDCNVISKSYSVLFWSFGKSKCEEGSLVWRDVERVASVAANLGLTPKQLDEFIVARVCQHKPYRKLLKGTCPKKERRPYVEPRRYGSEK